MTRAELAKWGPGAAAWALTLTSPAVFDLWAVHRQRRGIDQPTQSRTLAEVLTNRVAGPVLAGVAGGIFYHLFIEELVELVVGRTTAERVL